MIRRAASWLLFGVIVVTVAGVAYWAGTNAVVPPTLPVAEHTIETYTVRAGTVGSSIRIPVTASWAITRTLFAGSDGMVTSVVHRAGEPAQAGEVLATIDLQPIVIASGPIPMFRTLEVGVRGRDVVEFQRLLKAKGFFSGAADGRFGTTTVTATKKWQQSIRATADGIVELGSLLFVDHLPVRMEVLAVVGQPLSVGLDLVHVYAPQPDFIATVTASQRVEVSAGMAVSITAPDGTMWDGVLGSFEELDDGRSAVTLTGALCGEGCDQIPVGGRTALSGRIELIADTTGPVVPTSALVQQPSGELAVTLDDGTVRVVRVMVEADGFAVVDGLEPGTIIRLPSAPSP